MTTSTLVPTSDGTRLRVLTRGADRPGVPVVLVHGLASNARLWDGVAERLVHAGHPTHAVELRGHGESDAPDHGYTTYQAASDVLDVAAALELGSIVVVGQSWGGNVVVELAGRPDRVAAVVTVDGGAIDLRSAFADRESAVRALTPPVLAGTPRDAMEAMIRQHHPDFADWAVAAAMANFRVRDDGTIEPRLPLEHHLDIVRSMWDEPVAGALARVAVPTSLLLVSSKQGQGPVPRSDWLDAAVAEQPLLSLTWVEDRVHDVHAQDPDLVAAHVSDHLKTHDLGPGATP